MSDLDKFFGGGGKALKFPTKGTRHKLHVTGEPEIVQQTDFDSGELLFWPDNRPKMQAIVSGIVTEGLEGPDDDGSRRLFIKGYMQNAVNAALKAAGVKAPADGGVLTVTYSKDGVPQGRRQPPKLYTATYTPPSESNGSGGSTQHEDVPAQRTAKRTAKVTAPALENDDPPPF